MLVKIVDKIIDRLMEIKPLDCGVASNDWIDHVGHETPKCRKAMDEYWNKKRD